MNFSTNIKHEPFLLLSILCSQWFSNRDIGLASEPYTTTLRMA